MGEAESFDTDRVERGRATASGRCAANHLSPAYFSRTEGQAGARLRKESFEFGEEVRLRDFILKIVGYWFAG